MIFLKNMNTSLKYERLEINENKCRYSFEEENNDFESLEKLVSEPLNKYYSFTFNDSLLKTDQSEINYFEEKKQNLDIKENIILTILNEIKSKIIDIDNEELIIQFDYDTGKKSEVDEISVNIFNSINLVVHKTLHEKKMVKGKEFQECKIYNDLYKQSLELGENINFTDIDKLIRKLKEENKFFEFIAIKSIMISITNLMTELIGIYLEKNKKLKDNKNGDDDKEDKKIDSYFDKEESLKILEANIFEDIYKDFVYKSNLCSSELEEYFIFSLDSFREKYQMSFTLSELFTDIFWNSIFHNRDLCELFIDSYLNDEIYGDIKICLKKILKIIFDVNLPLKHQIVELLGLHQLENKDKNDLMTLIVYQKNINHSKIIKSEIENENLNKINNKKKNEENIDSNINTNNKKNENNNNIINNNIKNVENIKYNIITANDISVIKNKKQPLTDLKSINSNSILSINNSNNLALNIENNSEKQKGNKDKEKEKQDNYKNYLNKNNSNNNKNDNDNILDLEHKTVDEIYNYINDDKIVKNKRKKKNRKNKKAKKEEINIEDYQEEVEDRIVVQFKEDLSGKFIHAGNIKKIRPIFSEEWIKNISSHN